MLDTIKKMLAESEEVDSFENHYKQYVMSMQDKVIDFELERNRLLLDGKHNSVMLASTIRELDATLATSLEERYD